MYRRQVSVTKSRIMFAIVSVLAILSTIRAKSLPHRRASAVTSGSFIARDGGVTRDTSVFTLASDFEITAKTTTRTYDFTVSTATGAPDGYLREMLVINGQFPGPLIEANEGDTIVVNVHNTMSTGTGIHWHGMSQNGTNWADGVPGISQCPIPPKSSFTYQFTITDQYGTYWYHSHMANTMADGFLGPLIVHSPSDPYVRGRDYDYEQIIMLGDWMHDLSDTIVAGLLSPAGYRGSFIPPAPDSLLMNGVGVYDCNTTTNPCQTQTIPDVLVKPNKKYRFRVINHSSHVDFKFSIDEHPLDVVAADGVPIVAVTGVHQLPISVAQRYDVIVDTSVGTGGSAYYIRAAMCAASVANVPSDSALAALRYVDEGSEPTKTPPTSSDWSDSNNNETECTDFPDTSIVPYNPENAPTHIDDVAILSSTFGVITDTTNQTIARFFWNNVTWTNYIYRPTLFTIQNGGSLKDSIITHHVFSELGTVDIVVNNLDQVIDHPFHLHGRYFYLVARGNGAITSSTYPSLTFKTDNPPRRDTLVVPRSSHAVLRLITDDPGVWPFHCHIGWHLAAGKMAAIVVQPDTIKKQFVPSAAINLCAASNLPPGDNFDTTAPGKRRANNGLRGNVSPAGHHEP